MRFEMINKLLFFSRIVLTTLTTVSTLTEQDTTLLTSKPNLSLILPHLTKAAHDTDVFTKLQILQTLKTTDYEVFKQPRLSIHEKRSEFCSEYVRSLDISEAFMRKGIETMCNRIKMAGIKNFFSITKSCLRERKGSEIDDFSLLTEHAFEFYCSIKDDIRFVLTSFLQNSSNYLCLNQFCAVVDGSIKTLEHANRNKTDIIDCVIKRFILSTTFPYHFVKSNSNHHRQLINHKQCKAIENDRQKRHGTYERAGSQFSASKRKYRNLWLGIENAGKEEITEFPESKTVIDFDSIYPYNYYVTTVTFYGVLENSEVLLPVEDFIISEIERLKLKEYYFYAVWSVLTKEEGLRRSDIVRFKSGQYNAVSNEYDTDKTGALKIRNVSAHHSQKEFWVGIEDKGGQRRRYMRRYRLTVFTAVSIGEDKRCGDSITSGKVGDKVVASCHLSFYTWPLVNETSGETTIDKPIQFWEIRSKDGFVIPAKIEQLQSSITASVPLQFMQSIKTTLILKEDLNDCELVCKAGHHLFLNGVQSMNDSINVCTSWISVAFAPYARKHIDTIYYAKSGEYVQITCPYECFKACNYTFIDGKTSEVLYQGNVDSLNVTADGKERVILCMISKDANLPEIPLSIKSAIIAVYWDTIDYALLIFLILLVCLLLFWFLLCCLYRMADPITKENKPSSIEKLKVQDKQKYLTESTEVNVPDDQGDYALNEYVTSLEENKIKRVLVPRVASPSVQLDIDQTLKYKENCPTFETEDIYIEEEMSQQSNGKNVQRRVLIKDSKADVSNVNALTADTNMISTTTGRSNDEMSINSDDSNAEFSQSVIEMFSNDNVIYLRPDEVRYHLSEKEEMGGNCEDITEASNISDKIKVNSGNYLEDVRKIENSHPIVSEDASYSENIISITNSHLDRVQRSEKTFISAIHSMTSESTEIPEEDVSLKSE